MNEVAFSEVCNRVASAALCEPLPGQSCTFWEAASTGVPFYPAGEEVDPLALIGRAARGDIAAQREIAEQSLHLALTGRADVEPVLVLSEGLMLARMAAAQGDGRDAMRVVIMLSLASLLSSGECAADLAGEALARLELLADGENEFRETAAQLVASCAELETPETLEWAQVYRARLTEPA